MRKTLTALVLLALAPAAIAQQGYDPAVRIAAQKEAMAKLSAVSGEWRGPAKTLMRDGTWHEITQTERMGPMLDGVLREIEGRGYEADGKLSFNALGIISYNPDAKTYAFHSYAMGQQGDFPWMITPTGFAWETPAGPGMTTHYDITIRDGVWHEVGTLVTKDKPPVKTFEMILKRIGDTTWPAAGIVGPK